MSVDWLLDRAIKSNQCALYEMDTRLSCVHVKFHLTGFRGPIFYYYASDHVFIYVRLCAPLLIDIYVRN